MSGCWDHTPGSWSLGTALQDAPRRFRDAREDRVHTPAGHAREVRQRHTRGTSPEEVSGPRQVRGDQQEVVHQAQKHPGHRETPRRGQTLNTLPCARTQCPPGGGRTVRGLTSEFSQTQIKGPFPEKPTTDQSPWDSAPAGASRAQQSGWELTGSVPARHPGQAASHAHCLLEAC